MTFYPGDRSMNMRDDKLIRWTAGTLRLVVGALAAGLIGFAGVVATVQALGLEGDVDLRFVTWIGLGSMAVHVAVTPLIAGALDRTFKGLWMAAYIQRTVVACALMEGSALICLVGSLLDGQPLGLVAGLCGAALMVVLYWPTKERIRSFAERSREMEQLNSG
jgi:hypothetical protein